MKGVLHFCTCCNVKKVLFACICRVLLELKHNEVNDLRTMFNLYKNAIGETKHYIFRPGYRF